MFNKNIFKLFTIASIITCGVVKPVFAASTDVLVEDRYGKKYQYNIDQLVDSYMGDKKLYIDFMKKGETKAYYDSKIRRYVDVEKIVDAFITNSKFFNLDTFTENSTSSDALNVSGTIQTIIEENGLVKEGQVVDPNDLESYFDVKDIY